MVAPSTPLLLIIGLLTFLFGFFAGWKILTTALERRQRQIDAERKALNEGWRRLQARFGVDRSTFLADLRDRQTRGR